MMTIKKGVNPFVFVVAVPESKWQSREKTDSLWNADRLHGISKLKCVSSQLCPVV